MNALFYILLSALVIWIILSILPILLPLILCLIVVALLIGWYFYRKVHKQIDDINSEFENFDNDDFEEFTFFEQPSNDDSVHDVIDVEYTETETDENDE